MKIYKILFSILTTLSIYAYLYEVYLYEYTYVKFLPHNSVYPTYDIATNQRDLNEKSYKQDSLLSYVPWYGRVMYFIEVPLILFNCLTYYLLIIYALVINIRNKLYLNWKSVLIQLLLFISIYWLIEQTPFME